MYDKEPESIRSLIMFSLDNFEKLGISNFRISSPSFCIITFKIFLLAPLTISFTIPLTGDTILTSSSFLS